MLVNQSYAFIFSPRTTSIFEISINIFQSIGPNNQLKNQLLTPHITGGDDLHSYHSNLFSICSAISQ